MHLCPKINVVRSTVIAFLVLSLKLSAQEIYVPMPEVGDVHVNHHILPLHIIDVSQSGSGLIWNFTAAALNGTDTTRFISPDELPLGSFFPAANIAVLSHYDPYLRMLESSSSALVQHGEIIRLTETAQQEIVFESPLQVLSSPLALGDSYNGSTSAVADIENGNLFGLPWDILRGDFLRFRSDTVDATGTILLGGGQSYEVHRRKTVEIRLDSIYHSESLMGPWQFAFELRSDAVTYEWYRADDGYPVARVTYKNDTLFCISTIAQTAEPPSNRIQLEVLPDTLVADHQNYLIQLRALDYQTNQFTPDFNGTVQLSFPANSTVTYVGENWLQFVDGIGQVRQAVFSGPDDHIELRFTGDGVLPLVTSKPLVNIAVPQWRLEFAQVPDTTYSLQGDLTFQVIAVNENTGLIDTGFSDSISVRIYSEVSHISDHFILDVADAGVMTVAWPAFAQAGRVWLVANSPRARFSVADTWLDPTPLLTSMVSGYSFSESPAVVNSGTVSQPMIVTLVDTSGEHVPATGVTVRLGKLSGPGKLTGTLQKFTTEGTAVFDDISFSAPGTYQIIAFDHDSIMHDIATVTVEDYPWDNWHYSHTTSLSEYRDRASYFVWFGNADGYVSGTSRNWYDHIAQRFDFNGRGRIVAVDLFVGHRDIIGSPDDYVLKIFGDGITIGSDGFDYPNPRYTDLLPTFELGSQVFNIGDVVLSDFFNPNPTTIVFDNPVSVASDFHVVLEVNSQTANDTICLWTSMPGDGNDEYRTSRLMNSLNGEPVSIWLIDRVYRPQHDVDLMIVPIIERDTSALVTGETVHSAAKFNGYPNPTNGIVTIRLDAPCGANSSFIAIDLTGRSQPLIPVHFSNDAVTFDLKDLAEGVYVIKGLVDCALRLKVVKVGR